MPVYAEPLRRESAASRPATPVPAAEAIQRALPSVTEAVADWRAFRPEALTVAPLPGLPITFHRTALKDEGRHVTWIGRNAKLPGASFVGVATADGYDAILVLPGAGQFSYHVRGDHVVVEEADPADEVCGNLPGVLPKARPPEAAGDLISIQYAPGFTPLPDAYAETAPLKVDVLVAYDADTLAAAAGKSPDAAGYIDGQGRAMIESCNLALGQSGVTAFAWRYLGAVAAPAYTRTGKLTDDLSALAPNGAIAGWAATTRYERGADQLVLLVGGEADFGGIAYSPKQVAVRRDLGLAIVRWGRTYFTMAHELAHNFGCDHDRAHVNVIAPGEYGPPAPDSDGFWNYGQLWNIPDGTAGTIMSYADWRIPYFSNPNITVQVTGSLLGWSTNPNLGAQQTGRAETDPKAAHNVRVLNDQAAAMSELREEIVLPAISQQPQNVSVARGQAAVLSVVATGGGLAYQWRKGDVPLPGVHASSYSLVAQDSDVGGYTVVVSNRAGSVTSSVATLSITIPAPAPSFTNSGGGGGAPSLWFLGILGAGAVVRRLPTRRGR